MSALTHGEIQRINGRRVSSPEYRSWQMMKNRCLNPRATDYAYYGGQGVTVCPKWAASFEQFLLDMGRRPTLLHTLDRRDGSGGYNKDNCRWETRETQSRNRAYASTRVWELAEKIGVSAETARHYLWSVRAAKAGNPTRYTVSPRATAIIIEHMGELL